MRPTIFYSRYSGDIHSPRLLEQMKTLPIAKQFLYVCVDDKKKNEELFKVLELKRVPTLLVDNTLYTGDAAFQWVAQMKRRLQGHPVEDPSQSYVQEDDDYEARMHQMRLQQQQQLLLQQQQQQQQQYERPFQGSPSRQQQMAPPRQGFATGSRFNPAADSGRAPFQGVGAAGSDDYAGGLQGVSEEGSYANPFQPTPTPGMMRGPLSDDVTQPIHTRDEGDTKRMDQLVEMYQAQRDATTPQPMTRTPLGVGGGNNFQGFSAGAYGRR